MSGYKSDRNTPSPKGAAEHRKNIFTNIKRFASRLFYILRLVWESSPKILIAMCALCILDGILPVLGEKGIFLAAQCCEHLNRAIIIERELLQRLSLDEVAVRPVPKAGGSFASACYNRFDSPVAVEHIRAHAGIDIGGTLIGMHLKEVAVPVRLSLSRLGEANIIAARTRPKYIGGERAQY